MALVDAGGCNKIYGRAHPLRELGYRVAVLRDDDKQPDPEAEARFTGAGSQLFHWGAGLALEDELFRNLSIPAVTQLLAMAVELHDEDLVADQLRSRSGNRVTLADCRRTADQPTRALLGETARRCSWFKTVSRMEEVGRIAGSTLNDAQPTLRDTVLAIRYWIGDGGA